KYDNFKSQAQYDNVLIFIINFVAAIILGNALWNKRQIGKYLDEFIRLGLLTRRAIKYSDNWMRLFKDQAGPLFLNVRESFILKFVKAFLICWYMVILPILF